MATDVTMPRLSDSMEEGTILKWLVEEGGEVKRGEPLVEIETDKANMTYEADTDGVLIEVVAEEGDTLAIGEVIARIGEEGEAKAAAARTRSQARGGAAEEPRPRGAGAEAEEEPDRHGDEPRRPQPTLRRGDGDGAIKASPVARRMARSWAWSWRTSRARGPAGGSSRPTSRRPPKRRRRRRGQSQEPGRGRRQPPSARRARPEAGAKGEVEIHELTRLQQTVSRRMAESKATAPDFALNARRRHDRGGGAAQAAEGGGRPGAVVQRHGRQGRARPRCASTRA